LIDRAQHALLAQQHPEGYWQTALEANAEINAEYIIFNRFMELPPDPELDKKLAKQILKTQQEDGSWALLPRGEGRPLDHDRSLFRTEADGHASRRRAD
jgi:squalene-hopene/tetraprenyl-beta-curcumene cyclase